MGRKGPRFNPDNTKKEPGQQFDEFDKWKNGPQAPGYRVTDGRTKQQDQRELEEQADDAIGGTKYVVISLC